MENRFNELPRIGPSGLDFGNGILDRSVDFEQKEKTG